MRHKGASKAPSLQVVSTHLDTSEDTMCVYSILGTTEDGCCVVVILIPRAVATNTKEWRVGSGSFEWVQEVSLVSFLYDCSRISQDCSWFLFSISKLLWKHDCVRAKTLNTCARLCTPSTLLRSSLAPGLCHTAWRNYYSVSHPQ